MIDSPYLVEPGHKAKLAHRDPSDKGPFGDKEAAKAEIKKNLKRLRELQEVLYAGARHAVLVVFQAIDAGGKDGAVKHVFGGVNPEGCTVTSFKQPTKLELSHDFLWRIHAATPPKGTIGIFNRSQYESVLVERVHKLVPKQVWSRRYEQINQFEAMLADEGTTILKFFLHISKDEQKQRQQARIDDKEKNWKFDPNDLKERELWDQYAEAFEDAVTKCSTRHAPWYVVPSNHKWFRNWVLSDTIVRTLEKLNLKYPEAPPDVEKIKVK